MGFLGGDNDPNSGTNDLLDEELKFNKSELEAKKQSLYQTRLDIIKGQGQQVWTPDRTSHAPKPMGDSLPYGK